MATKSKRGAATPVPPSTSTPLSQSSSSAVGSPSNSGNATSPLSPTRHSRLAEKHELQNLNDRLAAYIDRVRHLEQENARLTVQIQSTQETVTRETSNLKMMYEHELSDARKLLDETAREKAKLEIDTKRLWEENDDLKKRLEKKTKEYIAADNSARLYEQRCLDMSGKYNTACAERKKAQDDAKDLEKENERLKKQLADLRKNLEQETLARVDLENQFQSLKEELTFKDQIHESELSETRSRRQIEISEIDGNLSQAYEAKLQQSLHELRDQYEAQMRNNRSDIEKLYEDKLSSLQGLFAKSGSVQASLREELRIQRERADNNVQRTNELENQLRMLTERLDAERNLHAAEKAALNAELDRWRNEMSQQLKEYQDLMDIKTSLDLEIAAYDKLLRGEESRLNITPTSAQHTSSFSDSLTRGTRITPSRATPSRKRTRTILEESEDRSFVDYTVTGSAKGEIEISEVEASGRYIKLRNKGQKEVNIGGWQLLKRAGEQETQFKFHRSVKIDAGASITIWSADIQGITHEPPTTIVMKGNKWVTADEVTTTLANADGEEVANSQRIKKTVTTRALRSRNYGDVSFDENIYHQQEAPQAEKCRIM